jgi:Fe-Mn family superoxide dismutase
VQGYFWLPLNPATVNSKFFIMSKPLHRRQFIKTSGRAGISAGILLSGLPSFASVKKASDGEIGYLQQPLPYGYPALEPAIDATTMSIHYTKHAAAYTKNLADACLAEKVDTNATSLEQLLKNISKYSPKMRNNGGGHYNHELFWQCMRPGTVSMPSGSLLNAITTFFGSWEAMKNQFSDVGKNRFGSGWAWLVLTSDKKLAIGSTPNQDNPLMDVSELRGKPLLGLDVWEHAYYLNYQNRRADYITNWWNLVNWEFVQNQYNQG